MIVTEQEAKAYAEVRVEAHVIEKLEILAIELARENEKQNLIAKATLPHLWTRHIVDSLQLMHFLDAAPPSWLDMGAGAGFPGLVLAAAMPETRFHLVESRRLRCVWLEHAACAMGLNNVAVLHSRLENVESRAFHAISARAFAPMDKLLSLSARFSTGDTQWVLPKGRSARQELEMLPTAVARMFHVEQSLTDPDAGIIVGKGRPERYT